MRLESSKKLRTSSSFRLISDILDEISERKYCPVAKEAMLKALNRATDAGLIGCKDAVPLKCELASTTVVA